MFLKNDPLIFAGHIRESVELHTYTSIRGGVALDWIIVNQNSEACGSQEVQTFLKIIHRHDGTLGGVEGKIDRK